MLLEGMHLPLTTPFHADGRLNTRKLEDNVARYAKTPAAGLVALGWSGQPTLLSDVETREALAAVAGACVPEKVLIGGVSRDSVSSTLDLIEYAAVHEYDAALVRVPSFLADGDTAELLGYFQAVADRSALPLILDGERMSEEAIVALARQQAGKILGVVERGTDSARVARLVKASSEFKYDVTVTMVFAATTGRMLARSKAAEAQLVSPAGLSGGSAVSVAPAAGLKTVKTRTKTVGFQILAGRTAGVLAALEAGAVGALPALAASAPQACYEVLAAWKDGDPALAAEKQERVRALALRVEEELGVAGLKYGCDLTGYFGGRPRLPGLPLSGVEREEMERLMVGIRN